MFFFFNSFFQNFPPPPPPPTRRAFFSERIEWRIEDQAFLLSYDSAPYSSPTTSPISKCLSFWVFLCVAGPAYTDGRRGEPNHTTPRKLDPLFQSSLVLSIYFLILLKNHRLGPPWKQNKFQSCDISVYLLCFPSSPFKQKCVKISKLFEVDLFLPKCDWAFLSWTEKTFLNVTTMS